MYVLLGLDTKLVIPNFCLVYCGGKRACPWSPLGDSGGPLAYCHRRQDTDLLYCHLIAKVLFDLQ
jgi:hypothetical protein